MADAPISALAAPPPAHDQREHRDETRGRIVDTALELIADHGFAATSTREISERLGFTKAALYYHFRTKDDLLAAIVEPVLRDVSRLVEGATADTSVAGRRRVLEAYVDLVATHADLMKVLANDPAVRQCHALAPIKSLQDELEHVLLATANPDARQRARAHAALGAALLAIMRSEPDDDREVVRDAAFAAACAVLGFPSGPRRGRAEPSAGTGGAGGAGRAHGSGQR